MDADASNGIQTKIVEEHDELDILDTLDLADESTQIKLKLVLLDNSDSIEDSIVSFSNYLKGRLNESHNEVLFDLGLDDNGDSLAFTKDDWDFALERLKVASNAANADIKILMTRNVGGEHEVGPINNKDRSLSGKILIRRRPESVDDVTETRIAVVGNGKGL